MALRKYTFLQRYQNILYGLVAGAAFGFGMAFALKFVLLYFGLSFFIPSLGFTFLSLLGGLIGAKIGSYFIPAESTYEYQKKIKSPFFSEYFYTQNFTLEEQADLLEIYENNQEAWNTLMGNFDAAVELIKPNYASEVETLKIGLHRRLLRQNADGDVLRQISSELRGVSKLRDIHNRFADLARICDLIVLVLENLNLPGGGAGSSPARIPLSLVRSQKSPFEEKESVRQPTQEQWNQHREEQRKFFDIVFNFIQQFFERFFNLPRSNARSDQDPKNDVPVFRQVGQYIIIDHATPYEVLGVSRGAPYNEIDRAYQALVKKWEWNPSRNPDEAAEAVEILEKGRKARQKIESLLKGNSASQHQAPPPPYSAHVSPPRGMRVR